METAANGVFMYGVHWTAHVLRLTQRQREHEVRQKYNGVTMGFVCFFRVAPLASGVDTVY